jgi:thymidylate synthase
MNGIVALCRCKNGKLGIGYRNKLPWVCKEDINFFRKQTLDKYIIMGRKTFESMNNNPLKGRKTHFIMSKSIQNTPTNTYSNTPPGTIDVFYINCKNKLLDYLKLKGISFSDVFVIGGSEIYSTFSKEISTFYVNIFPHNPDYTFDTYFEFPQKPMHVVSAEQYTNFKSIVYKDTNTKDTDTKDTDTKDSHDTIYLDFLHDTIKKGVSKDDRTGTGTISTFANQISFDISDYKLPLLTTKFVSFKMICEELLWFLSGDTDVENLRKKKCHIWDYNTSREFLDKSGKVDYKEGILVEGYGKQIRSFNGFDQLKYIENLIQNDPNSRRIMWNLWNSEKLDSMVLPPCHNQVQFYVDTLSRTLSCHMYQRSVDVFLGFPWNITSYSLLTFILCKRHSLKPGKLTISTGDTHVYLNHLNQSLLQIGRKNRYRPCPTIEISDDIVNTEWEDMSSSLFTLHGYLPQGSIKAQMS